MFHDYKDLLEQAEETTNPVVVEHEIVQRVDRAEDLLEQAEGITDPVVVPEDEHEAQDDALAAVKDLLADALKTHHDLRDPVVDAMSVPAMVDQFRDDDDEEIKLESLAQHPVTGGATQEEVDEANESDGGDGSGSDDDNPLDSLSVEDRRTVRDKLERIERMADRTPDYANRLRGDVADILELDDHDAVDDIDTEDL